MIVGSAKTYPNIISSSAFLELLYIRLRQARLHPRVRRVHSLPRRCIMHLHLLAHRQRALSYSWKSYRMGKVTTTDLRPGQERLRVRLIIYQTTYCRLLLSFLPFHPLPQLPLPRCSGSGPTTGRIRIPPVHVYIYLHSISFKYNSKPILDVGISTNSTVKLWQGSWNWGRLRRLNAVCASRSIIFFPQRTSFFTSSSSIERSSTGRVA